MDDPHTAEEAMAYFVKELTLEQLGPLRFRGSAGPGAGALVFGGQVLAQASLAAGHTVDPDRHQHSIHAYFLRGGDLKQAIDYVVEPARDGRSFSSRRVDAIQGNDTICELMISFAKFEEGIAHGDPPPEVPPPEELEPFVWTPPPGVNLEDLPPWPLETRPVLPFDRQAAEPGEDPRDIAWVRLKGPLPDDPRLHTAALAWESDANSFAAVVKRHGDFVHGPSASLDHALWIHRPFRWDDWMLEVMDNPVAHSARALSIRYFYTRDGLHVATMAQECVFRAPRQES